MACDACVRAPSDWVELWECIDPSCTSETLIIELNDNDRVAEGNTYTGNTGYMRVHFQTDSSVVRTGWSANWTSDGKVLLCACVCV